MDAPVALSPDVLASLPPAVVALIEWQAQQIRVLTARVAELEAKFGKNPTSSSKPPSSTHPHDKVPSSKPKSGRSRGGQRGHDKHERTLLPTAQCREVVRCVPTQCRRCGKALNGTDPEPLRHQV
jgi:transposase